MDGTLESMLLSESEDTSTCGRLAAFTVGTIGILYITWEEGIAISESGCLEKKIPPMKSEYPGNIVLESGPLESTGGKVWHASIEFFDFLKFRSDLTLLNCQAIELGSGCGWLGLRLCKEFPDMKLTMTEQGNFGALDWLRHNVNLNESIDVDVAELDWGHVSEDISNESWDVILGSELVYSYEGARLLPRVISRLLNKPSSVCYYCHSLYRFEAIDEVLIEEFKSNNLSFEIVYGESAFADFGSYTSLFPDLQTVIFRIVRNT